MTPRAKKIRDTTLRISLSVTGLGTVVAAIAPHVPNLLAPQYASRWLAAIMIAVVVATGAIVALLVLILEQHKEVGRDVVRAVHSRAQQDHNRDVMSSLAGIRQLLIDDQERSA